MNVLSVSILVCSVCLHNFQVIGDNLESKLYKYLLDDYSKLERPVDDYRKPLVVKLGVVLNQVIDMDEKKEIMHLNVWLNFVWHDYRMVWSPADFDNITDLRFPADKLWRPDVLLHNSVDPSFDTTFFTNLVVYSDGSVSWIPPAIVKTSCKLNILWFPFDEQICNLKFGSWTYTGSKLDLQTQSDQADLSEYIENGEWLLISKEITSI